MCLFLRVIVLFTMQTEWLKFLAKSVIQEIRFGLGAARCYRTDTVLLTCQYFEM